MLQELCFVPQVLFSSCFRHANFSAVWSPGSIFRSVLQPISHLSAKSARHQRRKLLSHQIPRGAQTEPLLICFLPIWLGTNTSFWLQRNRCKYLMLIFPTAKVHPSPIETCPPEEAPQLEAHAHSSGTNLESCPLSPWSNLPSNLNSARSFYQMMLGYRPRY